MDVEVLDDVTVDKVYDNAGKNIPFLRMYECPHCHTLVNAPEPVEQGDCPKCSWKGQVI